MTHLVIKNQGLIEAGDLTLLGSSTKRGDDTKIGMYGSGNKYALAWFLRNNIDIRIFSGKDEIILSHELVKHRNRDVAVLTVDGEKTSITSEMGPEWTGWMALREIISNAIDEGDYEIITGFNVEFKGFDDSTMIYIPLNNELNKVVREYDYYFAFDRKATFENDRGRVYVKTEQSLQNIYRKGIRCYDEKTRISWLDWNFNSITISEQRVCTDYSRDWAIKNYVEYSSDLPTDIFEYAIKDGVIPKYWNEKFEPHIKALVTKGRTFTTERAISLLGMMFAGPGALIIPEDWYEQCVKKGILKNPFKFEDVDFVEDPGYDVSQVKYYLMALGLEEIDVFGGKFEGGDIACNNAHTQFFLNKSIEDNPPKHTAIRILKECDTQYLVEKLL